MDDAVWAPTTFTKNRDRLLEGDIARAFFEDVVAQARGRRLLSAEHFTDRRHVAGGVGRPEEFQAEGAAQRPARRSGESDGQFPRRTALESDASVDDRSRQPVVQEGQGPRSEAGLSRRSADGEPPRPGGRRVRRAGDRHRRTRRRDESDRESAAPTRHHRRRQRLRHARLRRDAAHARRHAARRAEEERVARSIGGRRGIPATRSASARGNASKKSSAG